MALTFDVWHLFLLLTALSLLRLLLHWGAGQLLNTPYEPVGQAILNVYS